METPAISNWEKYRVQPNWHDYRDIDYTNEPFNDPESLAYWAKLGYANSKFTGDMYDMRRTAPDWMSATLDNFWNWEHASWSIYRMGPGTCLPLHSDTYTRFKQLHNLRDNDTIVRAVVFLEDWASGHYFEIDKTPIVNWTAGDTIQWNDSIPHMAANMGFTDRYTLQITGAI